MPIIFGTTASGGDNFFSPQPPTIGTATDVGTSRAYNNGAATVTFTPATSGGKPSTYTATSSPGSYTGSASSSPITVTGLQSATAYTYTVTATDSEGTSAPSSATGAVTATTVPQAPTLTAVDKTGVSSTGQVRVSFSGNNTGGTSITGYTVTASDNVTTATGTTSPLIVSGLTAGSNYTFTVVAANSNGNSLASSASSSIASSQYSCPSGGTLSGSTCTTTSSYGATYNAGAPNCNSYGSRYFYATYYPPGTGAGCVNGFNGAYFGGAGCYTCDRTTGQIYAAGAPSYPSAYYSCPSGGTLSGTTCYTSSSYSATLS